MDAKKVFLFWAAGGTVALILWGNTTYLMGNTTITFND